MKLLKQYGLVLIIFLLAVCLVLIRTYNRDKFRYDAVKWAASSIPGTNLITEDKILSNGGEALLINLGNTASADRKVQVKTVTMDPALILEKENIALIRKNKGPVILYSVDSSVAARVWMVLSETGMKNVYILQDENGTGSQN